MLAECQQLINMRDRIIGLVDTDHVGSLHAGPAVMSAKQLDDKIIEKIYSSNGDSNVGLW